MIYYVSQYDNLIMYSILGLLILEKSCGVHSAHCPNLGHSAGKIHFDRKSFWSNFEANLCVN